MTQKRWLGNAAAVFDLWTINAPTGTIVSQTYSVTINGKSVTYVAGGADTASTILAGIVAAINSTSPLPPPEFQELTATALPVGGPYTSLTIQQKTAGKPTSLSVSTSGAATYSITNTTAATGPSFFDNGANWAGGSAPANSDTLIFDTGNVPCKYNINTTLTGVTVNVYPGFTGTIGLPAINADNSNTYYEYRTQNLTLAGGTLYVNATSCQRVNVAFGSNLATVRVLGTGSRLDKSTPVVLLTGGNSSSTLTINKGDVGVAFYDTTSATFSTVGTGYMTTPASDVTLTVGLGATLTTINKNGGRAYLRVGATTITQQPDGGTLTLTDSAAVTTLNVMAGTVNFQSVGTVGTINLYNKATLDCSGDPRAKTVTNPINVYDSAVTVIDPQKTINSGVLSLATSDLVTVNVNHGGNSSIVFT